MLGSRSARFFSSSSSSSSFAAADAPLHYADGFLRSVLGSTKTIAMVGASSNPTRPSYFAAKYLQSKGFRVIPINPSVASKTSKTSKTGSKTSKTSSSGTTTTSSTEEGGTVTSEATILGERVYADLDDLLGEEDIQVDMVDVFRRPEDTVGYAAQAARLGAKHLWLQLGVVNHETRLSAEEQGLTVVMDRCPKIELFRPFWKPRLDLEI